MKKIQSSLVKLWYSFRTLVLTFGTLTTSCSAALKKQNQSAPVLGAWFALGDKSKSLKVFDISDDLTSGSSRANFTLRHFQQRLNIYKEQNFNFKIDKVKL